MTKGVILLFSKRAELPLAVHPSTEGLSVEEIRKIWRARLGYGESQPLKEISS
jgi:hypothetical protein